MKIGITGSSGFVGKEFLKRTDHIEFVRINLRDETWEEQDFADFDSVLHLAGKAHDMKNENPSEYYEVNVNLTKKLLDKSINSGVRQFIYVSSIKVYGDTVDGVINEKSPYNPTDDYGKSKQEAEELLLSSTDKISVAIIRPPLIYGPGVKGNMLKLVELAKKDIPLPFNNMGNARSMVSVGNLSSLISTILDQKAEGIFLASDGEAQSTTSLLKAIKDSLGLNHKLLSIPKFIISLLKLVKPSLHTRLYGNYVLDDSATRKQLNFTPNHTFEAGIKEMVEGYEPKL